VFEFILGNTFNFVVFMSFAAFWLTIGATLYPAFNAYGAYAPAGGDAGSGLDSQGFNASFGTIQEPRLGISKRENVC
jgi:uncharacterized protein